MNFCLLPESFRGGKYNPNVFKPGRNGNVTLVSARAHLGTTTNYDVRTEPDCDPWERRRLVGGLELSVATQRAGRDPSSVVPQCGTEVGRQRSQEVEEWWRCRSAFVSALDIRHSKFEIPSDGFALQSRHAAVLLQRARRSALARTRAGAEPRFVESLWREIENGQRRIALRLRLPRGARGNRPVAAPRRFAPDRPRQRTRLPKPDALADVFV